MRLRRSMVDFQLTACAAFWLIVVVIFSSVFGWSFSGLQSEIDSHKQTRHLERLCTKLTPVTSKEIATIALIRNEECLLRADHPCSEFFKRNGVGVCTETPNEESDLFKIAFVD